MKLFLIFLLVLFLLVGCASIGKVQRGVVQDLVNYDAQSAGTTRIAAREILSTWQLNSGVLSVVLVKFKDLLPCNCNGDIQTLNNLSAKCIAKDSNGLLTCQELSDNDLGIAVGTWAFVWGDIVKSGVSQIIQTFFPAVMAKILPYITALGL